MNVRRSGELQFIITLATVTKRFNLLEFYDDDIIHLLGIACEHFFKGGS